MLYLVENFHLCLLPKYHPLNNILKCASSVPDHSTGEACVCSATAYRGQIPLSLHIKI